MAQVSLSCEIDGIISTEESVSGMLKVIGTKTIRDSGTFWTWEGKVLRVGLSAHAKTLTSNRNIGGRGLRVTISRTAVQIELYLQL